uniref:Protein DETOXIFICATION n=1 Tax=Oryza meridionalis TaxID=40149 RepID=A0A0E0EMC7_9ORYZ
MSLKWRSVRVANELGAGSGKGARFAIVVSVTTSVAIGLVFWCLIIAYNDKIALLFSSSKVVLDAVSDLSVLLAFTVLLNSVQPGIWSGLIGGTAVQTLILAYLTIRCDWDEEAKKASTRMEVWGSSK